MTLIELLIEFLEARIGEEESDARWVAAITRERWWVDGPAEVSGKWWVYDTGENFTSKTIADHIAHYDPARSRSECEAKRMIVAHLKNAKHDVERAQRSSAIQVRPRQYGKQYAQEQEYAAYMKLDAVKCIAEHVAEIYHDHKDFNEEWLR